MDRCSSTQTKRHALTGAADLVKTLTSLGRATACNGRLLYPLCGREGHSLLDGWVQDAREHYGPTLETGAKDGVDARPTEMMSIRDPELTQWVLHRVRPTPSGRIPRRIHIGARVAASFRIRTYGV